MPGMKDICTSLFARSASADTQPRGGKLLLAQPFMDENYFSHSVVSLLDYDPKGGAMGVVLNHPSPSRLADLVDDCDVRTDIRVYCGGPLALDRLFFLHTLGADIIPGARPYMDGMYVGGDFDAVLDYANSGYPLEGRVRFFVGYSGWEEGQLEGEIAEGTWALSEPPASASELLKGSDDAFWHRCVRLLGPEFRSWRLVPRMACAN